MSGSEREELGRVVARMAVAQICETVGFHSLQASALETLADIAVRYLRDLAKAAHYYSNLACRVDSNAFDLLLALEDVGPIGPPPDVHRPISRSPALRELMRFVDYGDEKPFPRPLPRFPVAKKRLALPSFAQLGEAPPGSHIPLWLPALPDPHTYRATPAWPDRKRDPAANRLEQARQRRKAETSLVALHSRLSSTLAASKEQQQQPGGGRAPAAPPEPDEQQQMENGESGNPFVQPALEAGSKEVTPITFGGMLRGSIAEAFQSVVEAAGGDAGNGLELHEGTNTNNNNNVEEVVVGGHKRPLPESGSRSRVMFSFDFGGKLGGKEALAHKILGVDHSRLDAKKHKPGVVEDKDDRTRRAEQILAQSIDQLAA